VVDPKVHTIAKIAHTLPDGPVPATFAQYTQGTVLRLSLHTLIAMLFGIIFLMTVKPPLTNAIGVMLVSLFLGLFSGIPLLLAERTLVRAHS
jgi:hypothetical protein